MISIAQLQTYLISCCMRRFSYTFCTYINIVANVGVTLLTFLHYLYSPLINWHQYFSYSELLIFYQIVEGTEYNIFYTRIITRSFSCYKILIYLTNIILPNNEKKVNRK